MQSFFDESVKRDPLYYKGVVDLERNSSLSGTLEDQAQYCAACAPHPETAKASADYKPDAEHEPEVLLLKNRDSLKT
ncbi:hypothetical protein F5X99DRAFT_406913 [Biscogniauxia marginata]|nr:hypothetical protein F5X99DRAFT_406913 [Biscogniauxia marginata]